MSLSRQLVQNLHGLSDLCYANELGKPRIIRPSIFCPALGVCSTFCPPKMSDTDIDDAEFYSLLVAAGYGTPHNLTEQTKVKLRRLIQLSRSKALVEVDAPDADLLETLANMPDVGQDADFERSAARKPRVRARARTVMYRALSALIDRQLAKGK